MTVVRSTRWNMCCETKKKQRTQPWVTWVVWLEEMRNIKQMDKE